MWDLKKQGQESFTSGSCVMVWWYVQHDTCWGETPPFTSILLNLQNTPSVSRFRLQPTSLSPSFQFRIVLSRITRWNGLFLVYWTTGIAHTSWTCKNSFPRSFDKEFNIFTFKATLETNRRKCRSFFLMKHSLFLPSALILLTPTSHKKLKLFSHFAL